MKINIRKIEEEDFQQLIVLFKEFALFEKLPDRMTNSVEQMKLEKEYFNGILALSESGEILGFATYFFAYFSWVGKSLYMDDLFVKEKYRSEGIGTMLIKEVIDIAKLQKCKKLHWQVSNWNQPAIEFYRNLGAVVDDVESNCDLTL